MPLLEICVETPAAIAAACAGGADRIELCAALALGGLTPTPGLVALAVASGLPVMAMIRSIAGDFAYDAATLAVMADDIAHAAAMGVAGVVFGATRDAALDSDALAFLTAAARRAGERRGRSLATTLHRAIDLCADPLRAVDTAIALGFDNILSSGKAGAAPDGAPVLAAMNTRAAGRCTLIAGAGVTAHNVATLLAATGVGAIHASCTTAPPATSVLGFGPTTASPDAHRVAALRAAITGKS